MAIPSILTSPRALTDLEAVNLCLEALGDRRVSRVDQTTNSIKACTSLGRALMSVQSMGYEFSTREKASLLPGTGGGAPPGTGGAMNPPPGNYLTIPLPTNTMAAYGAGKDAHRSFYAQGVRLWDADRNTVLFPKGVAVELILVVAQPLHMLPAPASWYVAITAAIDFVGGLKPEDPVLRILAQTQEQARINLENMDIKVRPGGLISTSPHFHRIRGRNRRRR